MREFEEALDSVFERCGLSSLLDERKSEQLCRLFLRLISENEKYNLTAVTDLDGVILRHFADSAACAR